MKAQELATKINDLKSRLTAVAQDIQQIITVMRDDGMDMPELQPGLSNEETLDADDVLESACETFGYTDSPVSEAISYLSEAGEFLAAIDKIAKK